MVSTSSAELFIVELYKNGASPYQIAEQLGVAWNHMKVRRILKKMGVKTRDKSDAQSNALKTGRAKPPKQKTVNDAEGVYNTVEEKDTNE